MQFIEFKNKSSRLNPLSQVDINGSFDFYTSLVSLDALSAKDVQGMHNSFHEESFAEIIGRGALTPDQYLWAKKILPLATHEYTHFLDATSTLWGFRHLGLMNDAYLSSDSRGSSESQFSKAKRFYDHCRRLRLPTYYTTVNSSAENIRPWQSSITIGFLFSTDGVPTKEPILFSRFSNARGDLLCRSPVSTVSLLEASAMAQELIFQSKLIQLTEPDFRLVEHQEFTRQTLNYLYNPAITEYSVCVHIVANKQNCTDVLGAFRLCAVIVRTLLNLPEQAILKIAGSCPVAELLEQSRENNFAEEIRTGLYNGDLGVLFYVICLALPERSYVSGGAAIKGVVEALRILGIDFAALVSEAKTRASEWRAEICKSAIDPISTLAEAGYDNFLKIDGSDPDLNLVGLSLPQALLQDSSVAQFFGTESNLLKDFDVNTCFDQLVAGQLWVERFAEACV